MADLPMGQPPRIAGPVTGATPIGATGDQRGRQGDQERRGRDGKPAEPASAPAPVDLPPAPPDPLVEALDRLRATSEARPVDAEVARLLRAARAYRPSEPPAVPEDDPAGSDPI